MSAALSLNRIVLNQRLSGTTDGFAPNAALSPDSRPKAGWIRSGRFGAADAGNDEMVKRGTAA